MFRGGIPRPRDRKGVLVGRAAKAAESHTPEGHDASLKVHKAFLSSFKKKIIIIFIFIFIIIIIIIILVISIIIIIIKIVNFFVFLFIPNILKSFEKI